MMGRRTFPGGNRFRWLWIWLIQFASMLLASVLVALSLYLGKLVHGICLWGLMPLAGFASACAATRKGLLNYAAWIAPPIMEFVGNLLVWGYVPEAAPVFFLSFISLVGAATGEVLKRQARK